MAAQVRILHGLRQGGNYLPYLGSIIWYLSATRLFNIGGYACNAFSPILSGCQQIVAKIIHPPEIMRIGNVVSLNQEFERVSSAKERFHVI